MRDQTAAPRARTIRAWIGPKVADLVPHTGQSNGRTPAVVSRSTYARTAADVSPPLESPRILPTTGIGRPSTSDPAFLHWAMELTGVSRQPRDHDHGRWDVAPHVHTKAGAFGVCPTSCQRAPVRWRVT
jgi:hypothetical protein